MVDLSSSWVCATEGRSLSDVLTVRNDDDDDDPNENRAGSGAAGPVLLSQPEESAPCVLSLSCRPPAAITGLEVVTEARTAEVYDQRGEYCGTARGERHRGADSPDSEPFYMKRLHLDRPATSCEVKLLSLCGRRRVRVLSVAAAVVVAAARSDVPVDPSIDLRQVRSMMEEMGASLSPGAQHLMDMVQFQQQNHTSSLTSLFPLLIGGRAPSQLQVTPSAAEAPSNQNGAMSHDSPDSPCSESSESRSPVSPAHITEMMSQLLRGRGQALDSAPDLLPVLQSVCGHVTQLRLDNAVALKEASAVTCELEMERRLEQMEQRLREHFDKRLDALEQKLDSVLNLALMNQNHTHLTPKNSAEEKRNQATGNCN